MTSNNQLAFDDPPSRAYARSTDPQSSWGAAHVASRNVTQTQERVLALLRIKGPLSHEELITAWRDYWPDDKTSDQSIRSRCSDLAKGLTPLVRVSERTGTTSHGLACRCWEVVDHGSDSHLEA
jgi:hypothetical protein